MKKFTLIELLVVMAVLAILLSLLLPSISGARSKVKSAVCASQIKQLMTASLLYQNNNDAFYLRANNGHSGNIWDESISEYLGVKISADTRRNVRHYYYEDYPEIMEKMAKIVLCPNDTEWDPYEEGRLRRTFAMNSHIAAYTLSDDGRSWISRRRTDIEVPEETILFLEQQYAYNVFGMAMHSSGNSTWNFQVRPHTGYEDRTFHKTYHYNYGFVDGSVRLLFIPQTDANRYWHVFK